MDTYEWAKIQAGRRWARRTSFFGFLLFFTFPLWVLEWENESLAVWSIGTSLLGLFALIFAANRIAPKIPRCVKKELIKIIQDGEGHITFYKKELEKYEQKLAEVSSEEFVKRPWEAALEKNLYSVVALVESELGLARELDRKAPSQARLRNPQVFIDLAQAIRGLEELSCTLEAEAKIPPSFRKEMKKIQGHYQRAIQDVIVVLQESISKCKLISNEARSFLKSMR
ncbi:MAG: hypothetical protein WD003_01050 [Candidatus Paceibacterota bacterium]